jgi:hypothetical protein
VKNIVWQKPNGEIAVTIMAPNSPETERAHALSLQSRGAAPGAVLGFNMNIPNKRTFRKAWRFVNGKVEVDMSFAKDLKREQLRRMRSPLMSALDVEYMRADEKGDSIGKARIASQKQALRDVTLDPAIDAARTPDELEAVIPAPLRSTP